MEADKRELSEVYKELRKFTGAQDLDKWAADNSKLRKKEVKALIKKAIKDGQEKALRYDELKELDRLFVTQEITKEEYDNSPQKQAYEEYTSKVQTKVRGLDIICILQAILSAKTLPTYEQATDAAIDAAEKLIKEIHKATGCNAETAGFLAGLLIQSITYVTHYIYYPKEHAAFQKKLLNYNEQLAEVAKKITYPLKDEKNDQFYKEHERIANEMNKMLAEYIHGIYNYDKGYRIAEDIVIRLYPNIPSTAELPYFPLMNNSIIKLSKQILNNPNRLRSIRRGQLKETDLLTGEKRIEYRGSDVELTLTLKGQIKKTPKGIKVFNFFLQKLNDQNRKEITTFQLSELVEKGIYANKNSAYKGIENIIKTLQGIKLETIINITKTKSGKQKKIGQSGFTIIRSEETITFNQCCISFPPPIRESPYLTLMPVESYKALNDNSYTLLDYIFYMARQTQNSANIKKQGFFNISMDAIRQYMGLPAPKEAGRFPKKRIADPIEKAITEIEENQKEISIKITPTYYGDYENIDAYLSSYLKIELDEVANEYMIDRANALEKEIKKELKRIEKAKQTAANKAIENEIKQG